LIKIFATESAGEEDLVHHEDHEGHEEEKTFIPRGGLKAKASHCGSIFSPLRALRIFVVNFPGLQRPGSPRRSRRTRRGKDFYPKRRLEGASFPPPLNSLSSSYLRIFVVNSPKFCGAKHPAN
jgi:hypothetical protein